MVYSLILIGITLIGLIIATITDLKTKEVPDWLSYGLIAIGLSLNLLFSIIYKNYWFFINSLAGFILFLIVALVMFYTAQWGGGDSKILMGLGALIGFDVRFTELPFLVNLLVNILLIGAIYGLMWSFVLALGNWNNFYKELKRVSHSKTMIKSRKYIIVLSFLMLALFFFTRRTIFSFLLLGFLLMVLLMFYLWISVKAIEKSCMLKSITPNKLTEGDWIVKNIKYKGKHICGPKDLGIEKKQIKQLIKLYRQNKIKKVLIKEGIPFVPSLLIAYVISLMFGNLLFLLI